MDGHFKIKSYGYGELAQLYFPNITPKSASWQLRKWIVASPRLIILLNETGYKSKSKLLTPVQVRIIVMEFGEP